MKTVPPTHSCNIRKFRYGPRGRPASRPCTVRRSMLVYCSLNMSRNREVLCSRTCSNIRSKRARRQAARGKIRPQLRRRNAPNNHASGGRVDSARSSASKAAKIEPRTRQLGNEIEHLLGSRQLPRLKIKPRQEQILLRRTWFKT